MPKGTNRYQKLSKIPKDTTGYQRIPKDTKGYQRIVIIQADIEDECREGTDTTNV